LICMILVTRETCSSSGKRVSLRCSVTRVTGYVGRRARKQRLRLSPEVADNKQERRGNHESRKGKIFRA
jgi:hypothetical protein